MSKSPPRCSTIKIERVSDAEYKLEVENCEMSDAGAYRVVLSTESESIESSCTVTVKEKAVKVGGIVVPLGTCREDAQHWEAGTRQKIRPHRMGVPLRKGVRGRYPEYLSWLR